MTEDLIERYAIRCAKGNNVGEWSTHYTEEQKDFWRRFVYDLVVDVRKDKGVVYNSDSISRSYIIYQIMAERERQISKECWSIEHDDAHAKGEMARAAAMYALPEPYRQITILANHEKQVQLDRYMWPWEASWWKPTNRRRDLIKAAALIVAEIERLSRADASADK